MRKWERVRGSMLGVEAGKEVDGGAGVGGGQLVSLTRRMSRWAMDQSDGCTYRGERVVEWKREWLIVGVVVAGGEGKSQIWHGRSI